MKLYLVRHGIATDKIGGPIANDFQRPLTERGRIETRQIAQVLKKLAINVDLILTSPLVRAYQTAEILADEWQAQQVLRVCDHLAPAGDISDIYKTISQWAQAKNIFLVGHEPDISRLAKALLWAGPELGISFAKSGVCLINVDSLPPSSPGTLAWFVNPEIFSPLIHSAGH